MANELDAIQESRDRLRKANEEAATALGVLRLDIYRASRAGYTHGEICKASGFMSTASVDPLMIMITTAGVKTDTTGNESICYRLFKYGQDVARGVEVDPSFFFAWWGASDGDDPSLPSTWEKANPGYGDLLDPEDFEANYKQAVAKGTLNDFKTKRLNMWVDSSRAWLPDGWWDKCATLAEDDWVVPAKGVVLGFDGSRSGDNTALVAVTVEHEPKVKPSGICSGLTGV